jgi:hypothetical protein
MVKSSTTNRSWRYANLLIGLPIVLGVVFILLTLKTAPFHEASLLLRFSITIPEIIIWIIAMSGAVKLKQYAVSIIDDQDGKAYNYIADSLLLLVMYVILLTSFSTVTLLFTDSSYLRIAVIARNYVPIIIVLASAWLLFLGSQKLIHITRRNIWNLHNLVVLALPFVGFLIMYSRRFYEIVPSLTDINDVPRFATPVHVLFFTYILPHVIVWMLGVMSCVNLAQYAAHVPGSIYRSLFSSLYKGIMLVYIGILGAQAIIISSAVLTKFGAMAGIIYGVLLLGAAGFILVYRGVNKLQQIEHTT